MITVKYTVYYANLININNEAVTVCRTLYITAFQRQLVFKNWNFVLPVEGTPVQKHVGDTPLILF